MSISAGRLDRVFAKLEATYGADAGLAAADFIRTTGGSITHEPFGYVDNPERTAGDDMSAPLRRRSVTSATLSALIRGAPNGHDAPELDALWQSLFGAPPVEVDAVGDTTAQANEDRILGVVSGGQNGDGLLYPVIGKTGGATATVAVPGTAEYASRNYHLARAVQSLTVRTQPASAGATAGIGPGTPGAPAQEATGWCVGEAAITIDGTGEASVNFSGPARNATQGAALTAIDIDSAPAAGSYPKGIDAKLWFSDLSQSSPTWAEVAAGFRTMSVNITNGFVARNDESGSAFARSVYRPNQRAVAVEISTYAEQNNALWAAIAAAQAVSPQTAMVVSWGNVTGGRAMLYLPFVNFNLPPPDGADDAQGYQFTGRGSGDGQEAVALCLG